MNDKAWKKDEKIDGHWITEDGWRLADLTGISAPIMPNEADEIVRDEYGDIVLFMKRIPMSQDDEAMKDRLAFLFTTQDKTLRIISPFDWVKKDDPDIREESKNRLKDFVENLK